jgi:precorrin-3B methylase
MLDFGIDMFTVVIIGNSQTYIANGKMITPRGYIINRKNLYSAGLTGFTGLY